MAVGELYTLPCRRKAGKVCENIALNSILRVKPDSVVEKVYKLDEKTLYKAMKNNKLWIGMPHAEVKAQKNSPVSRPRRQRRKQSPTSQTIGSIQR